MDPEIVVNRNCAVGESPLWHPDEQCLYWVDIPAGKLYRYDPSTGDVDEWQENRPIGGFTIQADGALLLFMGEGCIKTWKAGTSETVVDHLPDERGNRFNDVIADPEGRVFCGTMSTDKRQGRLYRLDVDGTISCVLEDIGTSNGLGFTPDRTQLYYTDTRRHNIYLFDYDQGSGEIQHQRVFVHVPDDREERPDGMTVDSEGKVWSAHWAGYRIVRYDAHGQELESYSFPMPKVSSLTFGGKDYTDIYITTAGGDKRKTEGKSAGALFYLPAPVSGVPEFRSRVLL